MVSKSCDFICDCDYAIGKWIKRDNTIQAKFNISDNLFINSNVWSVLLIHGTYINLRTCSIIYRIYHNSVFDIWLQTHNNTRNQKNNCGKSSRYEKNCVEFDTFICCGVSFYEKRKKEITI